MENMENFVLNDETVKMVLTGVMENATVLAVTMFAGEVVKSIFAPRPTKIVLDSDLTANMTIVGKKGKPKAIYVTTKKLRGNFLPPLIFAGAALACYGALKSLEKDVEVIG